MSLSYHPKEAAVGAVHAPGTGSVKARLSEHEVATISLAVYMADATVDAAIYQEQASFCLAAIYQGVHIDSRTIWLAVGS